LKDAWLWQLERDESIHASGWYTPPPDGIIVAFGKPEDGYQRVSQPSFRPEYTWPSDVSINLKTDIMTVWAGPVCRNTHLIGDFGLELYMGDDPDIEAHFIHVLNTYRKIIETIEVGMRFCDIYHHAMALSRDQGFFNKIISSTDQVGSNIGHTIPFS